MAAKRVNGSAAGLSEPVHIDTRTEEPDPIAPGNTPDADEPTDGIPTVEPTSIPREPDESGKRGRGRPRGSTKSASSSTRASSDKETANDLTGVLLSTHMMLAAFLQVKELEIDQNEAARLAQAVTRVNKLYGGFMLSEKTMAWINLLMAGGGIYGPRFVAFSARTKKENASKPVTIDAQPGAIH
jgi:hypothetical protein